MDDIPVDPRPRPRIANRGLRFGADVDDELRGPKKGEADESCDARTLDDAHPDAQKVRKSPVRSREMRREMRRDVMDGRGVGVDPTREGTATYFPPRRRQSILG